MRHLMPQLLGLVVLLRHRSRDERGLSQSTENAILLAGAVSIAVIVITVLSVYVKSHLPK